MEAVLVPYEPGPPRLGMVRIYGDRLMVAAAPQSLIDSRHQDRFLVMLPWIETLARRAVKRLPLRLRAEFVADVVAKAWVAFARLSEHRPPAGRQRPMAGSAVPHL